MKKVYKKPASHCVELSDKENVICSSDTEMGFGGTGVAGARGESKFRGFGFDDSDDEYDE